MNFASIDVEQAELWRSTLDAAAIGARFCFLLACLRSGGSLPNTEKTLARAAGVSVKSWRSLIDDPVFAATLDISSEEVSCPVAAAALAHAGRASTKARAAARRRWGADDTLPKVDDMASVADAHNRHKPLNNNDLDYAQALQVQCQGKVREGKVRESPAVASSESSGSSITTCKTTCCNESEIYEDLNFMLLKLDVDDAAVDWLWKVKDRSKYLNKWSQGLTLDEYPKIDIEGLFGEVLLTIAEKYSALITNSNEGHAALHTWKYFEKAVTEKIISVALQNNRLTVEAYAKFSPALQRIRAAQEVERTS
ncbi:hypothetical protein KL86PLE_130514 [uncultured Pleomorphomonas sp.]|uniref:Uncharacterized protein n=1 Tax=uncultured Pleomorphomonas sp. TaxID=442121 RepID=A0A212LC21_9HYPH|nr:hypothetical protein [uncultured Pleomorphomonas sp.]SCM70057.1 hypothetical protein KL86PLE_10021 [uncultured Pleomorphomonas sp.]SCM75113.1 hypothetical protein KL86PLE_130514 [uncultured Pleomorphomonas sp.]